MRKKDDVTAVIQPRLRRLTAASLTLIIVRKEEHMKPFFALLLVCTAMLTHVAACAENDYQKARRSFEQGKYEEALHHHISFHDNILKTEPAMYGVRLSFALSSWVDLGQKYPAALTALKDIRDQKTVRLAGGEQSVELFHDVESINEHLGEEAATVSLFKTIEGKSPTFARKVLGIAEDALVQGKEYKLARKYMGEPATVLESAKRLYEQDMKYAERNPRSDQSSERAFRNIFARRVLSLLTILRNTDDEARAKEIQAEALKIVDDDRIRNALRN